MSTKKKTEEKEKKESFWKTFPGIITAITGLIVAITGLITVLSDEGLQGGSGATPTAFPTVTPVDSDVILPTPVSATQVPDPGAPTCQDFVEYQKAGNPNGVILAFTDDEFWVRYGELEEGIGDLSNLTATIFAPDPAGGECLRKWVRFLGESRTSHWPFATSSQGRTYSEVWMGSPVPPRVGELAGWTVIPDMLLTTVVNEDLTPDYMQVYHCGEDIPEEILARTAYWHAGTDEDAFSGYLILYQANGFEIRPTVPCQ
jgi:hypothetical protein